MRACHKKLQIRKPEKNHRWWLAVIASCFAATGILLTAPTGQAVAAETQAGDRDMVKFFGDFRFRLEEDWDSQNSGRVERDERTRARIRARLGLKVTPNDNVELLTRVRSGSRHSQQSPHVTVVDFEQNDRGDEHVLFDKWYLKLENEQYWAWVGRENLPFWKQNELLWDDDATVAGLAAGASYPVGSGKLALNAGFVRLPDGMTRFNGDMSVGQLVYTTNFNEIDLTAAGGVLVMDGEDDAKYLLNGNGGRDYTIWVLDLQAKTRAFELPLTLGLDVYHNSENYSRAEVAAFFNPATTKVSRNDTDGFVASALVGQLKNKGDWQVGYSYARIETFAVNASFAQDDWMRWGSSDGTQTTGSDFRGHEFRLAYVPWKNWDILARYYDVESNNNPQDGKRFRLDLNWKF